MRTELEARPHHTPILRRALAGVVLIVAVALVVKLVVGFVIAIFWTIVAIAAVAAILWALKTIFW
jgi:flagellar biosynthesis protein FliQ